MIELNGVLIPPGYSGIGAHDTPGCYSGVMDYNQAVVHARELKAHGFSAYKLFSEGMKVERAQAYRDNGILTVVRFWAGNELWGRPPGQWVTGKDKIQPFVDVGVQLMELHWNEFNIDCEWVGGKTPADPGLIARTVMDAWEVGLDKAGEVPGCIPLFPSNTPGGSVDHRWCYEALAEEIDRRGLAPTIQHVAVHNRPHNNPPGTVWTATNTVTFDEHRWIRDTLKQVGVNAYYWATEHGYSINDDQNHDYPQIDLRRHTDYNWALSRKMDPSHPYPTEPEFAGFFHWFEAGWGHWGSWAADALRDSIVPEMPAPSPLWIKMGAEVDALRFERYAEQPAQDFQIIDVTAQIRHYAASRRQLLIDRDCINIERPPVRVANYVNRLVIHHAGAGERVRDDPLEYAKMITRWSVDHNHFPTMPYHYMVVATPDGGVVILKTLDDDIVGYHAGRWTFNLYSFGLMMSGDNTVDEPTELQIQAMCWLVKELDKPKLWAHKQVIPGKTECPGDLRKSWWLRVRKCHTESQA